MKAAISFMGNEAAGLHKAVFFDRDGTLNVDVHYLYRPEDFQWTPGAIDAIRYCNDHGYLVIVITNQSGVARGYYTEADVHRLHDWMNADLAKHGAHIDAFYYCPHHVEGKVPEYTKLCDCRKPSPKLVDEACMAYKINRVESFFIGDKELDMKCAVNAGVSGIRYTGGSLLACLRLGMEKVMEPKNEI